MWLNVGHVMWLQESVKEENGDPNPLLERNRRYIPNLLLG